MRESSAERRAKIELWNKERENPEPARDHNSKPEDGNHRFDHNDGRSPHENNQHPSEQGNGDYDF